MQAQIRYGKANVALYRTYARPMDGVQLIPESRFSGRDNILLAADVDVEVFGDNFLPAYTRGDNSMVVATDTMKNFIHQKALEYEGATLEGLLEFLGRQFLDAYPQMQNLRMRGRELQFVAVRVPHGDGEEFGASRVLFSQARDDRAVAELDLSRDVVGPVVVGHRCGREGLRLMKVTGSSFARFHRDEYTTLPEVVDRPLFIHLDVYWKYRDVGDATSTNLARYIPAEQVRDVCQVMFHEFVSMSIQHLVNEMGTRLLDRFPHMAEVSFEAQNRLWDTAVVSEANESVKVYCDPRPPYGSIGLTLTRE